MTTSDDGHPFDAIIRLGVTAPLKSAGFRKSARSFHRRRGSCVQVVNIQLSQSSTADEKRFYINVGVAFDAICALKNIPVLEKPKEHECDARGTRDRLGRLLPGLAADWDVGTDTDVPSAADRLARDMSSLVAELDQIDGPATYRQHRWFDRYRPMPANAQILYLIGDREGARLEVDRLAANFADRQNANRADWWMQELGLSGLAEAPRA